MGFTNSMQILHGDSTFILQDEIPEVSEPFIDDIPVKGPESRYQDKDGNFETIPENPGIRRFIWEHLGNVNRVIQRIKHAGGTFSGLKSTLCSETAVIVGHKCTMEGRLPDESRVQKIVDWPICKNLTEVRGFLGMLGTIRIFIKDFASLAKPLVNLTRKDVEFEFGEEQLMTMEKLKLCAQKCEAIKAISYQSDLEVTLAVDSSWMAVGFILSQQGTDGKRYPSIYGSLTWNETEQRYSQAKLELYRLFRALKAVKMYIIGVKNLVVEVDAKYIKGMINNPDIQPSVTLNRWIACILLFDFKLRHVSAKDHTPADGLSRRRRSPDEDDDTDTEDWIDNACGLSIELINESPDSRIKKGSIDRTPSFRVHKDVPDQDLGQTWFTQTKSTLASEVLKIPRTEKAEERDKQLKIIDKFLRDPTRIAGAPEIDCQKFIRAVTKFFVLNDKLWRKDRQGRHKLVIWEDKCLELIRQAHDDLGHKGIFTVRMRLAERFWWPHMDSDIRWFIQTCHECQI